MLRVMCIYPTFLEQGGYIYRDQVVSIPEELTHSPRIRRHFRNVDGTPIEPIGGAPKQEAEAAQSPTGSGDSDISGLLTLSREELVRKASDLGIAVTTRTTKEAIARLIVEAGTNAAFI